jgi:hypothetical protein
MPEPNNEAIRHSPFHVQHQPAAWNVQRELPTRDVRSDESGAAPILGCAVVVLFVYGIICLIGILAQLWNGT